MVDPFGFLPVFGVRIFSVSLEADLVMIYLPLGVNNDVLFMSLTNIQYKVNNFLSQLLQSYLIFVHK
jgi:hypothetical protein